MQSYEYTVIPAPARGVKTRGARSGIERFSVALSMEINRMAEDGWDYVRAEVLPCEERTGFTGRQTVYHNVLVFRRALAVAHVTTPAPRVAELRAPQPAPQPTARHEPPMSAAPQGQPPADWPDAQPARATLDADQLDERGTAALAEEPTPGPSSTRTGIFSSSMQTAKSATRLGGVER